VAQTFVLDEPVREVVMALHLTPEQVRALYTDFKSSLYEPKISGD
jgi:hypothetical protein